MSARPPPAPVATSAPWRRRDRALAGAIVLAVLAAVFWRLLALGETPVQRDALSFTLPSREFLAAALRAGRLPEWGDQIGLGVPFAANPIHGVTSPWLWLVAVVPPPLGQDLLSVALLAVAGLGTASLARRLGASPLGAGLAGALYAGGGYAVTTLPAGMPPILAFAPWVAALADRLALAPAGPAGRGEVLRAGGLLAGALALQAHGGEPISLSDAGLLALLVGLSRGAPPGRTLLRLGGAALAALPLAAAALLPGLGVLGWTDRLSGYDAAFTSTWSLAPLRLLELAWPGLTGHGVEPWLDAAWVVANGSNGRASGPVWATSLHLGVPALVLAALQVAGRRRDAWLAAGAALFLLLALGPATPAWGLWRAINPLEAMARYPEKHVAPALLLLAALAGAGASHVLAAPTRRQAAALAVGALTLGALVLGAWRSRGPLAAWLDGRAQRVGFPLDAEGTLARACADGAWAVAAAALVAVVVGLLALLPRPAAAADGGRSDGRPGPVSCPLAGGLAVVAILGAHLALHAGGTLATAPRALVASPPAVLAGLPPAAGGPRPRVLLLPGRTRGDEWADGPAIARMTHERAMQDVVARFGLAALPGFDSFEGEAMGRWRASTAGQPAGVAAAVVGAPWVLAPQELAPGLGLPVVAASPEAVLLSVPLARPRALVAAPDGSLDAPLGPCEVASPVPERVVLECHAAAAGEAVLLDAPAPGWSAELDGRPAPLRGRAGTFRAVSVPAGAHRVVLTYRTPWLRVGALVALLSWFGLGLVLRRTRPAPT